MSLNTVTPDTVHVNLSAETVVNPPVPIEVNPEILRALIKGNQTSSLAQQQRQLDFYGFQPKDRFVVRAKDKKGFWWIQRVTMPLTAAVTVEDLKWPREGFEAVYLHPDVVDPEIITRFEPKLTQILASNKSKNEDGGAVQDKNIHSYRTIKIDVDPKRLTGTSGTEAQHEHSALIALRIHSLVKKLLGYANGAIIDSGNGFQVHLRVDLPVTEEPMVVRYLAVLGALFDEPGYRIDHTLSNPARIIPLVGTMKRKGSDDPDTGKRHRLCRFYGFKGEQSVLNVEQTRGLLGKLEALLTPEQIDALGTPVPEAVEAPKASNIQPQPSDYTKQSNFFEVAYQIPILDVMSALGLTIEPLTCPFCGANDHGVWTAEQKGVPFVGCHHDSCTGKWGKGAKKKCAAGPNLVSLMLHNGAAIKGDVAKEVIAWYRQHFDGQVPGEKNKGELARERAEARAASAKAEARRLLGRPDSTQEPQGALKGESAPEGEPTSSAQKEIFARQDLGNARRFINQHRDNVRYCGPFRSWVGWNGQTWVKDDQEIRLVKQMAHQTVDSLEELVVEAETPEEVLAAKAFARSSGNSPRIKGMLEQAQGLPGVPIEPMELDADAWLLNCPNGTVDLRTGILREHRREDYCTKMTGVPYDPEAKCPKFLAFMERVQPKQDVRNFILKYDGYSVTGVIREHLLPIHRGEGRNGKGVHQAVMLKVIGNYATTVNPKLFVNLGSHSGDQAERYRIALFKSRMVFSSETDKNAKMNVSEVKTITGGDTIKGKKLYQDEFEFEPSHKLQLSTQNKLKINENSHAIWSRLMLLPWEVVIPPEEQILDLAEQIVAEEGPGVLALVVQYCMRWQREGLKPPESIQTASQAYRDEEDTLGQWLADVCIRDPKAKTGAGDAYHYYSTWCDANGFHPLNATNFGVDLGSRFKKSRDSQKGDRNVYIGFRINPSNDGSVMEGGELILASKSNLITEEEIEQILAKNTDASSGPPDAPPEAPEGVGESPIGGLDNLGDDNSSDPLKRLSPRGAGASGFQKNRDDLRPKTTDEVQPEPMPREKVLTYNQAHPVNVRLIGGNHLVLVRLKKQATDGKMFGQNQIHVIDPNEPNRSALIEAYGIPDGLIDEQRTPLDESRRLIVKIVQIPNGTAKFVSVHVAAPPEAVGL